MDLTGTTKLEWFMSDQYNEGHDVNEYLTEQGKNMVKRDFTFDSQSPSVKEYEEVLKSHGYINKYDLPHESQAKNLRLKFMPLTLP